jgi:hypothetical protein
MRRVLLIVALAMGCDTVQDRPETWSYVHAAVIAPSCATASCHSKISSVNGFDLSSPESAYTMFTGGRSCGGADDHPGALAINEARARIIGVLEGRGTRGEGASQTSDLLMPPDQALSTTEIQLVKDWFDAGALCD